MNSIVTFDPSTSTGTHIIGTISTATHIGMTFINPCLEAPDLPSEGPLRFFNSQERFDIIHSFILPNNLMDILPEFCDGNLKIRNINKILPYSRRFTDMKLLLEDRNFGHFFKGIDIGTCVSDKTGFWNSDWYTGVVINRRPNRAIRDYDTFVKAAPLYSVSWFRSDHINPTYFCHDPELSYEFKDLKILQDYKKELRQPEKMTDMNDPQYLINQKVIVMTYPWVVSSTELPFKNATILFQDKKFPDYWKVRFEDGAETFVYNGDIALSLEEFTQRKEKINN